MNTLVHLAIFLVIKATCGEQNLTCLMTSKKYMFIYTDDLGVNYTVFTGFTIFKEMLPGCGHKYRIQDRSDSTSLLVFLPKRPLMIDESYNTVGFYIIDWRDFSKVHMLILQNLKGIENTQAISNQLESDLIIAFSKFDFYLNSTLINETDCELLVGANTFFYLFSSLFLINVKFPKFICPSIFANSAIQRLELHDISDSLLKRNKFNVINYGQVKKNKIKDLTLKMTYVRLTQCLFSKHMFLAVKSLVIQGVLYDIESDIFKDFKLRTLELNIENLKDFFHRGTSWMKSLNLHSSIHEAKQNLKKNSMIIRFGYPTSYGLFNKMYEYPDEDFCLFKHFPHERLVFPALIFSKKMNCSCTMSFLVQNNLLFWNEPNEVFNDKEYLYYHNYLALTNYNATFQYCSSQMYNSTAKSCDFVRMIDNCNRTNFESATVSSFFLRNDTDVHFLIIWVKFILLILLKPLFCLVAVVTNVLVILVITNKKQKKLFKDLMYKLIILNAVFNICYSAIMALKLLNECLFYTSTIFCSSVYQWHLSQYVKIIIVQFLGNTFKTCSSLSYIAFSFSRFILVNEKNKRNKYFQRFIQLSMKKFIVCFILLGGLLSFYKLFQYRVNVIHLPLKSFPYEIYDENMCKEQKKRHICQLFTSLKIADSAANDIIFFVVCLTIDFCLFVSFKKEIKLKKKISNMKAEDLDKKQGDLSKMIIINGVIYFVSHSPEFVTSVLLVVFARRISNFCRSKIPCDIFNENAQFFCLISISLQFFIFLRFNHNFQTSYKSLKQDFFKKICKIK